MQPATATHQDLRNDRDTSFRVVLAGVHQRRLVVAVGQPWFRTIGTRQQHPGTGRRKWNGSVRKWSGVCEKVEWSV